MVNNNGGGGMVKSGRSRGPPTSFECIGSIRASITGSQGTQTPIIDHRAVNESMSGLARGELGFSGGGTMGSHTFLAVLGLFLGLIIAPSGITYRLVCFR